MPSLAVARQPEQVEGEVSVVPHFMSSALELDGCPCDGVAVHLDAARFGCGGGLREVRSAPRRNELMRAFSWLESPSVQPEIRGVGLKMLAQEGLEPGRKSVETEIADHRRAAGLKDPLRQFIREAVLKLGAEQRVGGVEEADVRPRGGRA